MIKYLLLIWFGEKTVETIVADLQRTVDDLKSHAAKQDAKADEHHNKAAEHLNSAALARAEFDKAVAISENIGKLIGA